jgi:tripartite-type tricarboxylate transporter receptor subunit TctC
MEMVMRFGRGPVRAGLLAVVSVQAIIGLQPAIARAQTPLDFYKSRAITLVIGGGVGGAYDAYYRTFARYLTRHIPGNPNIIAKNLPAASGLAAANTLYTTAEKDGSVIGALTNSVPMDPLFGNPGARYDALKFNWIGSIGKLQNVCSTWHTSPIKSITQAQEREVIVSSGGITTNSAIIPRVLNALLDTKFRVVSGYDLARASLCRSSAERSKAFAACRGRP